ncbi:MAG: ADP-ribosylglycohydrolase family protein [Nitrospinaceae bacterium]
MLGAIAGDIIGSVYEHRPVKTTDFPLFQPHSRFTDDTVLTIAVAHHILSGDPLRETFHDYFARYPGAGYGSAFARWASRRDPLPYNSWGNGAAMRVSPVGFAGSTLERVLDLARKTAAVTHNHPEGIRGAQSAAAAVFLARTGKDKDQIRDFIQDHFQYPLEAPLTLLRERHTFDVSCQGTVPPAITAFLESSSFEDAVRNAVSLGGDSDTLACIAGAIAHAYYGKIPPPIAGEALSRLDPPLRDTVLRFTDRYGCS